MLLQKFLAPKSLPYNFQEWKKKPFRERAKMICKAWALDGFGAPVSVLGFYVIKILIYIGLWFYFCSYSSSLGSIFEIHDWFFSLEALGKAIVWTTLFEVIGLGGGSGPLTGRYVPPFGGMTYFLRLNTIKHPFFRNLPFIGNDRRNILDVLLYGVFIILGFLICFSSEINTYLLLVFILLIPILGILDRTIFLAARADIYFPILICLLFPLESLMGLKMMWFGIWFWAAFSKLTLNFTSVISVMICNSPVFQFSIFEGMKKKLFHSFPNDLRPSKRANYIAHFGTIVEFSMPILLLIFSFSSEIVFVALVIMSLFHFFIFMNFPMGVPMEWNVIMVYGGWVLFGYHIDVFVWEITHPILILTLSISLFILPILGHLYPKYISFLLSMRYYAGTWGYSVWLFKGDALKKIDENITKTSPALMTQLEKIYETEIAEAALTKVIAFRMMHLPGRLIHQLIPKTVENINDYTWMDGEFIAGEILGWNFGDGHLHNEQLLDSVQKRCQFKEGELRLIRVESPSFFTQNLDWEIYDAHSGLIEKGRSNTKDLKNRLPWGEVVIE